jgi:hypothetical protein
MGKKVFANGREISAAANDNKCVASMPDLCLSPPSPPAGPVPIPYPNFANAGATIKGTKRVKIGGKEVGKKNKSAYKKSRGNEAATRSFGMGVVSHTLQGKTKFASWSMDVKVEKANVTRQLDLTGGNHSSDPANSANTTASVAGAAVAPPDQTTCEELDLKNEEARKNDLKPTSKGFTLTTASFSPPGGGPSRFLKAVTPGDLVRSDKASGYAKSNSKKTMACSGKEYGASSPRKSAVENQKTRNHTEPKLMEPIFQAAGASGGGKPLGTLTMKIFHKDVGKPADAMPCDSCKEAICAATSCGLDIKLCDKDNQPADPPCDKGKPAPASTWIAAGLG